MRGWDHAFAALEAPARQQFEAAPRTVLLGTNRTVIAHGQYAWRGTGWRWQAWRPDPTRRPIDHYQLTAGWPGHAATEDTHPVLILDEGDEGLPPEWLAGFAPPDRLGEARLPRAHGQDLHLVLWRTRLRAQPLPAGTPGP
jgi:hypothetical protein